MHQWFVLFFSHGNIHVIFRKLIKKKLEENPAAVFALEAVNFTEDQKETC